MSASNPYLCESCPGKGNTAVDFDVQGYCVRFTADSFKQARRFWIEDAGSYGNDISELAAAISGGLIYYDEEVDDNYFASGDYDSARLGGLCAQQFLEGRCSKKLEEILAESETD